MRGSGLDDVPGGSARSSRCPSSGRRRRRTQRGWSEATGSPCGSWLTCSCRPTRAGRGTGRSGRTGPVPDVPRPAPRRHERARRRERPPSGDAGPGRPRVVETDDGAVRARHRRRRPQGRRRPRASVPCRVSRCVRARGGHGRPLEGTRAWRKRRSPPSARNGDRSTDKAGAGRTDGRHGRSLCYSLASRCLFRTMTKE